MTIHQKLAIFLKKNCAAQKRLQIEDSWSQIIKCPRFFFVFCCQKCQNSSSTLIRGRPSQRMELLGEVEEHLRALSVEARKAKQLSGVKEAAERGTLKCRSLKEGYAGYLRQKRKQEEESGESADLDRGPGLKGAPQVEQWSGFQCPDLLQPFLLVRKAPKRRKCVGCVFGSHFRATTARWLTQKGEPQAHPSGTDPP